jgi:WhiB family redox-sensing transcriptional regulator
MWYPDRTTGLAARDEARAVCRDLCPVRTACLLHALERREPFGIWGGHTEHERRSMLRARGRGMLVAAQEG